MARYFSGLVLACALTNLSVPALADPPVAPFYQSLAGVRAEGRLGQVIRKEKIATSVPNAVAWRIAYISSDALERKTISTALVVAPSGKTGAGNRPIMTYAHGTTGAAQNCGPSAVLDPARPLNEYFLVGGDSWTDYGLPNVEHFIADGYVVVGTDYQGLGGGGKHQYAVAATQARDTINAARAVRAMTETGAGNRAVAYGWSQGGGAVLAAASLPDYVGAKGTAADGIAFIGFVALAPYTAAPFPDAPIDQAASDRILTGLVKTYSDNSLGFAHFSMALYGTQAAYPDLKLTDVLTEEGAKAVDAIYANKCVHAAADTLAFTYGTQFSKLLNSTPSNTLAWAKAFLKGSIVPVKPFAPVVIYWGTKDTTQPPVQGEIYQKQMCAMGATNIDRVQLPGEQSHFTTPGAAADFYRGWIRDRLAGRPVSNTCSQN